MLRQYPRAIDSFVRLLDLALIVVAFGLSIWSDPLLLHALGGSSVKFAEQNTTQYILFVILALLSWIGLSLYMGVYRSHRAEPLTFILQLHLKTQLAWMVVIGSLVFVIKFNAFNRSLIALFLLYTSSLLIARLAIVVAFVHGLRRRGYNLRQIAIVGDATHAQAFARFIRQKPEIGYEVTEIKEIRAKDAATAGANPELEDIFILAPDIESVALQMLKRGKRVHILPGMFDAQLFRREFDDFAGVPVLSVGGSGLNVLRVALKRVFDVLASALLLTLLCPALALIALAIKLTSRGPVLFEQERLGQKGRRFRLFKFRTMVTNAEEILRGDPILYQRYIENNFKLPRGEDPRITLLGRFLRRTSLDELLQLFNVLRGDMSLVGPRPIVPPEIELYGEYADLFLSVKPGLTGNWQVNGRSEISDYAHRTTMDLEYIRDQSFGKDVSILLKTIPAVMLGKGAH